MSGGSLDYSPYHLEECIDKIEKSIKENGKSIQQIWNEKS